jgi:death-on-curing protein
MEIHRAQIERYGGSPELRDLGLLQSALATPMGQFSGNYLYEFPHEMAAAYLFHLVSSHPFVDGNKRTGAVAAHAFLLMNGLVFEPDEKAYGDLVLAVASGQVGKEAAAAFMKSHIRPVA